MKTLRAVTRLLFFAFYTLYKSGQIIFANLLLRADMRRTLRIRQRWAKVLLPMIGLQVHKQGTAPDFPCILMANHRSYLDPAVLARDVPGYGVAKAEMANWPVVGWGARVAGVLFIRREDPKSRKVTLSGIAGKVKEGFPVILFVEGTTHTQPATVDFKPGGFKLAAAEGLNIVPVAIEFESKADYWVDDDTFLPHLFRRFKVKKRHVHVHYGPVMRGSDPEALLRDTRAWIDGELSTMQKGFLEKPLK
jgi:1-acyl-sn-glycerol-3-phosphate acyltransferase